MEKCIKCKNYDNTNQGCWYMDADCKNGEKFEPITNYDRIKSMSVEKMTALITKLAFFPCELCEREHNASCTHEDCFNIHKQWLLQEISEENITKIEHNSLCETKTYKNTIMGEQNE